MRFDLSALLGAAPPVIELEDIDRFDGRAWSGLRLGETTGGEIKDKYKTQGGTFLRGEAIILSSPSRDIGVQALLDGRGKDARLTGIYLTYQSDGPDLKDLMDRLKSEPETWYARERYDEWRVETFPERGIVAFVEGDGRSERVPVVLLLRPSRVRDVIADCERSATRITDYRDLEDRFRDRVAEIGSFSVRISTSGVRLRDKDRAESDLEEDLRRRRTPREIEFRRGGSGSASVTLNASYKKDKRKGTVSASVSLDAETPLGRVSASGSESDDFNSDDDEPEWRGARNFERVFDLALNDAVRNLSDKVRAQKPPSPAVLRRAAWIAAINRATK